MVQPGDEVKVDGHPIALRRETIVLMFHKPAGFVTTNAERERDKSVFGLLDGVLPDELRGYGWHAVGRLDKGTTGLLLFTNDERFVEHATAPTSNLPKRYAATVQGDPRQGELELLRQGMELDDGPTKPAKARVRSQGVVELTLTEGRNHQAKRMLGAIGFPVLALHREAIGTLELDIEEGQVRVLTDAEVEGELGFKPRVG
jgi:23S rRNA pseudouridine2605 synthase/16S rRNA pseudouridine516 synthase